MLSILVKIHSHKWKSRKINGLKLEHTYFKYNCSLSDYIPVNIFLSIYLPGCSIKVAKGRLGWKNGSWEIRGFFHFSCTENECKKLKLYFIKSKRNTKEVHFGEIVIFIMFIVNSSITEIALLTYIEVK